MGVITFNGVSSDSVGLHVETFPNFRTAERDYEVIHVPGRNGDVYIDKGAYKNTKRTYTVSFGSYKKDLSEQIQPVIDWLYSTDEYAVLYDTYEPDTYWMARFNGPTDFANILGRAGRATIEFDCKPQRYLYSGDFPLNFSAEGTIVNPTQFPSSPIIKVNGSGSGTVTINDITISLSDLTNPAIIDCEMQDVFNEDRTENLNNTIFIPNFPILKRGISSISFGEGVTSVEITPRWWTI